MTPEEYNWHISLVKDRYHTLNLSFEQAEQVHRYEQEKNTFSDKHFFSVWEEWDYELTTFREILNEEQTKLYEEHLHASIKRYEQSQIEHDVERTNEISYYEELIRFYEENFLPDLFKDRFIRFDWLLSDKSKIEYLRNEYKRFLNDTKKEILTSHFRHNRTFKPNELKLSLLRHKLCYIFPDYGYFKHGMDEPTRAVVDYLKIKVRHLPEETEHLLTRKYKELKEFSDSNFKKHYGEIKDGWHVVARELSDEEVKEHRSMSLLLFDQEKYGH